MSSSMTKEVPPFGVLTSPHKELGFQVYTVRRWIRWIQMDQMDRFLDQGHPLK